ncbi:unnamed protein product [Prunus armeniaca]
MGRRCTAQWLKKSKQLQFTPIMQAANEVGSPSSRQASMNGKRDDVELVPPDPGQPNREAQIGSCNNPNKKDQDERIRPEGSLEEDWKPEEDVELVPLDPDQLDKKARIGLRLSPDEKVELTTFLQNNKYMFAWSPSDMLGIDPNIICHRLHVNHASNPVVQKRRNFAPERVAIIEAEIDKLLAPGFIEKVSYSEWLANVVLVAKQEKGKWRVCVDYTDLNKAYPKDNFPLPRIDQLVDSTSDNQLLSFMDAYSGYNQIMMYDDNKTKTFFIIERGTDCYKVMPFGLKNAGATY